MRLVGARSKSHLRFPFPAVAVWAAAACIAVLTFGANVVHAQSNVDIADAVDQTGQYTEKSTDGSIAESIDRANAQGIGFVWLDSNQAGDQQARDIVDELDRIGSRYRTVVVLTNEGLYAYSVAADPDPAADASIDAFGRGAVAEGLTTFTDRFAGTGTGGSSTSGPESATDGGGGISGWLLGIVAAVAAFFGIRYFSDKRKKAKAETELLELDRQEIKEQLRDNADRVIELGDLVIARNDPELIRNYEEASAAFQSVSTEIDQAATIEEVDRLDDKIDHAEWQFEVIEARLEGRTPPTAPAPEADDSRSAPVTTPANDRPALGADESVVSGRAPANQQPRSSGRPRYQTRRRTRRGGMGGLGGGIGGALGSVILGGGLGRPRTTRRTQRRRSSTGSFGGLGGGVLRPTGSGRSSSGRSSSGRSSRGRSGGGSFGRRSGGSRGKGGGGSF